MFTYTPNRTAVVRTHLKRCRTRKLKFFVRAYGSGLVFRKTTTNEEKHKTTAMICVAECQSGVQNSNSVKSTSRFRVHSTAHVLHINEIAAIVMRLRQQRQQR